jgi:ATP-dependent DNA helicase RecQ
LYDLLEIRFFLDQLRLTSDVFTISDETWENAKRELNNKFRESTKLEVCNNIIRDFELTNPNRKFKSDLEVFIHESKLEDFLNESGETVFVSTIHKAKGKEFDNVFLMLENFNLVTDQAKRQLYVALTRAKQRLTIHLNGDHFNNIIVEGLERIKDMKIYSPQNELVVHLSFKDVWLDYFITRQKNISQLISGDPLIVKDDECITKKGHSILKFSKQFLSTIESHRQKGYVPKQARVNFVVYWQKENSDQEVKIILPELHFIKTT